MEDVAWYYRVAPHAMSVRNYEGKKIIVRHGERVLARIDYMSRMPGFTFLGLPSEEPVEIEEVDEEVVETPKIGKIMKDTFPGFSKELPKEEVIEGDPDVDSLYPEPSQEVKVVKEEEEVVSTGIPEKHIERLSQLSNIEWGQLKSEEAKNILLESGVEPEGSKRWDFIKQLKGLYEEQTSAK